MKILIFGVTGMLGNAILRKFANNPDKYNVVGTARTGQLLHCFEPTITKHIITGIDVGNHDSLIQVFAKVQPQVVINCVGLVKQLAEANDPLITIPLNSLLPHRLASLCLASGARLIHISTDCVFSGSKGNYLESDFPDAKDLYGRSKLLGEVDYTHTITLRTSIIGHELAGNHSLIGWFLSQTEIVKGFTKAIFSGLPTIELAQVIQDFVLPRPELSGLYHVAAQPIDKYSLLKLVAEIYGKTIDIIPDEGLAIDRSLNAQRFYDATGYTPPIWPELIQKMYQFQ